MFTRISLGLILWASAAAAQVPFEIRGTVSEAGLGGIGGAEITARLLTGLTLDTTTMLRATADGSGTFVLRTLSPGNYEVMAAMNGYGYAPDSAFYFSVLVDSEHPRAEIPIHLVRPGELTGRVIDADTREPIQGLKVQAVRRLANGQAGSPLLVSTPDGKLPVTRDEASGRAETDKEGVFRVRHLGPADYVVSTSPVERAASLTEYAAEDLKSFDESYGASYWPGGGNLLVAENSSGF